MVGSSFSSLSPSPSPGSEGTSGAGCPFVNDQISEIAVPV